MGCLSLDSTGRVGLLEADRPEGGLRGPWVLVSPGLTGLLLSPEVGQNSMWISTEAAASVLEPLKVVWAKCSGYPSYPALVSSSAGGALLGLSWRQLSQLCGCGAGASV